jgi:hypothetical protein
VTDSPRVLTGWDGDGLDDAEMAAEDDDTLLEVLDDESVD